MAKDACNKADARTFLYTVCAHGGTATCNDIREWTSLRRPQRAAEDARKLLAELGVANPFSAVSSRHAGLVHKGDGVYRYTIRQDVHRAILNGLLDKTLVQTRLF